jgi:hypothetical protein
MSEEDAQDTRKPEKAAPSGSRSERLAAALKRNLSKRKAQQRARQAKAAAPSRD